MGNAAKSLSHLDAGALQCVVTIVGHQGHRQGVCTVVRSGNVG
jgi:hypothetical protein